MFYCLLLRGSGCSLIDYLTTGIRNFSLIKQFDVLVLNVFSDHCSVTCTVPIVKFGEIHNAQPYNEDKIIWNHEKRNELLLKPEGKRHLFHDINDKPLNNDDAIDPCISELSQLKYNTSFDMFGRTFLHTGSTVHRQEKLKSNPWYNQDCRNDKCEYHKCKRIFKSQPNETNRIMFLNAKNNNAYTRIRGKYRFNNMQGKTYFGKFGKL